MKQYYNLVKEIYKNGTDKEDRTGVGTRSIFGYQAKFNLYDEFPLVTLRPTSLRIAFEEMMFFLRGQTNTKKLEEKNINIWKGNTSREFLDDRGLTHLREGNMGKGYGYQWRNFGDQTDQIRHVFSQLRNNPQSRRHIVSAWNPNQINDMALPPCHIMFQFYVNNKELSTQVYIRSNDVPFGTPYNIAGYSFLTYAFAEALDLKPKELVYTIGDAHIYKNQFDMVETMLERKPRESPQIEFNTGLHAIQHILKMDYDDIDLINYYPYPDIEDKPEMAV